MTMRKRRMADDLAKVLEAIDMEVLDETIGRDPFDNLIDTQRGEELFFAHLHQPCIPCASRKPVPAGF
jgi:hypothetical protein